MTSKFDPAFFLYLNPGIPADLESAQTYASEHPECTFGSNDLLPKNFDGFIFIEQHGQAIDVSGINSLLMTRDEFLTCFVKNLMVAAELSSTNTFRTLSSITSFGISCGDDVRIRRGRYCVTVARVVAVDHKAGRLILHNPSFNYSPQDGCNERYVLEGIRIKDPLRVATIAYFRGAYDGPCEVIDDFNADLYRLLYPDTRCMTPAEAYNDCLVHIAACRPRIKSVDDLAVCGAIQKVIRGISDDFCKTSMDTVPTTSAVLGFVEGCTSIGFY
jgi:hypothetical protein